MENGLTSTQPCGPTRTLTLTPLPPVAPIIIYQQTYDAVVDLLAELQVLAEADIFVGTYSSNIARYTVLVREANNFAQNTTGSVDKEFWFPGRSLLLADQNRHTSREY